jgi:hypothetical protein
MAQHRLLVIGSAVVGVAFVALAILYVSEPASSLPALVPGHDAGSSHHHVKHGIAALILGVGAFVLAWFHTGPRRDAEHA